MASRVKFLELREDSEGEYLKEKLFILKVGKFCFAVFLYCHT